MVIQQEALRAPESTYIVLILCQCFNPQSTIHNPQSTHPRGVRRVIALGMIVTVFCFNPRTREGCDFILPWSFRISTAFQSTHPRGVRLYPSLVFQNFDGVSIHAPARGATSYDWIILLMNCVSIHAPARGATPECTGCLHLRPVSIHAPARGATMYFGIS